MAGVNASAFLLMAYCTSDDIEADFKGVEFTSTTAVTDDQLDQIIEEESAYINGRIGVKYEVPVDADADSDTMLILKRICIFRVSERVKNILEIKSGDLQMSSEQKQSGNYIRTPNDDLALIAKGLLLLEQATLKGTDQGVSSFNSDECIGHVIDVTKQQW